MIEVVQRSLAGHILFPKLRIPGAGAQRPPCERLPVSVVHIMINNRVLHSSVEIIAALVSGDASGRFSRQPERVLIES
jgi:hypothetical protein